jgi:pseudouridine-5'-phosphate glycosidase
METLSITVVGYRSDCFPGFYLADSGHRLEYRVETPENVAEMMRAQISGGALLVANPAPNPMDPATHQRLLDAALAEAQKQGIKGKAVTPFILERFHQASEGLSLSINTEIIKSNAELAAKIAVAVAK